MTERFTRIVLLPDAADDLRIAEELQAWAQARAAWAVSGFPEWGLKRAGTCPRCGDNLKYIPGHPRFEFIVWCDRTDCLVVSERYEEDAC